MPPPPPPAQPAPPAPPPVAEPAAAPGHHAAYLAAINDLRQAKMLLRHSSGGPNGVKWDENAAIKEIQATIRLLHDAKFDVGAAPEDEHQDSPKVGRDRLEEAKVKIGDAALNLSQKEDTDAARRTLHDAAEHLNAARRLVNDALDARKGKK
jgi:hypothetical protein